MNTTTMMSHCASAKNPPKGYGSVSNGMKVAAYRSKRLAYWMKALNVTGYNSEVFTNAQADVVAEYGQPF